MIVLNILLILPVFLVNSGLSQSTFNIENLLHITEMYFDFRQIKLLTFFTCFDLETHANLYKALSKSNFSVQIIQQLETWEYPEYSTIGVVADMDCEVAWSYLKNSTENLYFMNKFIWLFYDKSGNRTDNDFKFFFRDLDVLPISEVIVVSSLLRDKNVHPVILDRKMWKLFDVYKLSEKHELLITEIGGDASSCHDLQHAIVEFGTVGSRRRNLQGMYMNSAIVVSVFMLLI